MNKICAITIAMSRLLKVKKDMKDGVAVYGGDYRSH